jgi:hypothetical protein
MTTRLASRDTIGLDPPMLLQDLTTNELDSEAGNLFGDLFSIAMGAAGIASLAFVPEVSIPLGLLTSVGGAGSIGFGTYGLFGDF